MKYFIHGFKDMSRIRFERQNNYGHIMLPSVVYFTNFGECFLFIRGRVRKAVFPDFNFLS